MNRIGRKKIYRVDDSWLDDRNNKSSVRPYLKLPVGGVQPGGVEGELAHHAALPRRLEPADARRRRTGYVLMLPRSAPLTSGKNFTEVFG